MIPINIQPFFSKKNKEKLFDSFLNLTSDGIVVVDLEGRVLEVNKKFEELHGWMREEIVGQVLPMTPASEKDEAFRLYRRIIQGEEISAIEAPKLRKDGSSFYANVTISPIKDDRGEVIAFVGVERDITEKKRAEEELRESEERYRVLVECSPEPILVYEQDRIVFANPAAVNLVGAKMPEDLVGEHVSRFWHPDDMACLPMRIRELLREEKASDMTEQKLIRLNGDVLHVEMRAVPIKFKDRQSVQLLFRDVTDRKKAEEMIRRSEKLSVVGELAAGVAHEIRNPLTALKGFMQLLQAKHTDYVDIMMIEIDRINTIVNEFMTIAKPQAVNVVECRVPQLVENVVAFMQPQAILFNVQVRLEMDSELPPIRCEPNQIKQVLMNVLKNAIESMPHGGFIDILAHTGESGNMIVRVTDQGVGIPGERLAKIGEPFFSTKESGTGLGLMVSHRIIEAHRGRMSIWSQVNQGTTVEIELPANHAEGA